MRKLVLVLMLCAGVCYGQARTGLKKVAAIKAPSAAAGSGSITLTVDADAVDADLNGVIIPLRVCVGSAVGISDADITVVFDDLGAASNKIHFTQDGAELYAEVEHWDATAECAALWVGVNSLSNATDTIIAMTWDAAGAANTDYIGGLGSDVATNVWEDWSGIYHCAGYTQAIDSTAARLHLYSSNTPAFTNGIEGCQNTAFHIADENGGWQSPGTDTFLGDDVTALGWMHFDVSPGHGTHRLINQWGTSSSYEWLLTTSSNASGVNIRAALHDGTYEIVDCTGVVHNATWNFGAMHGGASKTLEVWHEDIKSADTASPDSDGIDDKNQYREIIWPGTGITPVGGDEMWVSANYYSDEYITTMYEIMRDNAITYTVD